MMRINGVLRLSEITPGMIHRVKGPLHGVGVVFTSLTKDALRAALKEAPLSLRVSSNPGTTPLASFLGSLPLLLQEGTVAVPWFSPNVQLIRGTNCEKRRKVPS